MRIYLCDDEGQILRDMAAQVRSMRPDSRVMCFEGGGSLWDALGEGRCDVLCLDIDMPGMSGLELAGRLGELATKPLLVFVTSHDELVYDSLRFHPFGFVRKTCFAEEMEPLLADCEAELRQREENGGDGRPAAEAACFTFQSGDGRVRLPLREILYFESEGNYVKLFAREGVEYRFRDTLHALEERLSESGFIRIHKGFLVNQRAVRVLHGSGAELEGGRLLPIGKSYGGAARHRLMRYMLEIGGR